MSETTPTPLSTTHEWYSPRLMNRFGLLIALFGSLLAGPSNAATECHYMKSREGLHGYETGGPYLLDHFLLTKGRTELRDFLWKHWHDHKLGVAEAKAGTVDRGVVTVLYIVEPDAKGNWGIDAEMDRPMDPPCITFHGDSLVRIPIRNPDEDYPSQTLGLWPEDKIPPGRLADSEVIDPKLYRLILVREKKPISDAI